MTAPLDQIARHLQNGSPIWLFLDYDGTLSDFAPNPDIIEPKPEVIECIQQLAAHPLIRVSIVSGRRLKHVKDLVPVSGILLAGTYGIEILTPEEKNVFREDYETIRPVLEWLKPRWEALITKHNGFYLEDKGWALAIHARYANNHIASQVLAAALKYISEITNTDQFRVLGGDRFLEFGSNKANKGETIRYLLDQFPFKNALPVYVGDDDKDEEAFEVIIAAGGIAVQVAAQDGSSLASARLDNPKAVLAWLKTLII
jgi:trehalose-phosphatase